MQGSGCQSVTQPSGRINDGEKSGIEMWRSWKKKKESKSENYRWQKKVPKNEM